MAKLFLTIKSLGCVAALSVSALLTAGCAESYFRIASDSRLPQGMIIPPGLTRADVSATVDYYTFGQAKFILRNKEGKKLEVMTGHIKSNPVYPNGNGRQDKPTYPVYVLVAINGKIEIMEHKHADDILNITDDLSIRYSLLGRK